jgi:hypothetical protein
MAMSRRQPRIDDVDHRDAGGALVVALLASMLLAALGHGLVLLTNTDQSIAANYHAGIETAYAADAAIATVLPDLRRTPDWSPVLSGAMRSGFADGTRTPVLASGETIDLNQMTAALQAQSASAPWGGNNPVWRLYAWGPVERLAAGSRSRAYIAVWVADDPAEIDGNAGADSNRTVLVLAEAFGPNRSRRSVAATVGAREGDRGEEFRPRLWSWREVR